MVRPTHLRIAATVLFLTAACAPDSGGDSGTVAEADALASSTITLGDRPGGPDLPRRPEVALNMTSAETADCWLLADAYWHPAQEASDERLGWEAAAEYGTSADVTLPPEVWFIRPGLSPPGSAEAVPVPRAFETAQQMVDHLFAGPPAGGGLVLVRSGVTGATACLWSVWDWTYLYVYLHGECRPPSELSVFPGLSIADHFWPLVQPRRQVVLFAPDGLTDPSVSPEEGMAARYMEATLRLPECLQGTDGRAPLPMVTTTLVEAEPEDESVAEVPPPDSSSDGAPEATTSTTTATTTAPGIGDAPTTTSGRPTLPTIPVPGGGGPGGGGTP